jgi:Endonuclease/Exonuclease/phosphatase family
MRKTAERFRRSERAVMLTIYAQNIWGGQVFGPLCERLVQLRDQVHIFCLQEVLSSADGVQPYTPVRTNLLAELQHRLPDHRPLFCNIQSGFDPDGHVTYAVDFGQAMFLHRSILLQHHFKSFIFRTENALSAASSEPVGWGLGRAIQVVAIVYEHESYVIGNVHGLWHPSGKGDIPERLQQSSNIVAAMQRTSAEKKIIVGDFNVQSQTQSIKLIEAAGYRNLVTEYAIMDTRTVFYHKTPRQADYAFVSRAVTVEDFHVDQTPVSDHAALVLAVT